MNRWRWHPQCVYHQGKRSEEFVNTFFAEPNRKLLLVAGVGFDARCLCLAKLLHTVAGSRVRGVFIEERRELDPDLTETTKSHKERLIDWFPDTKVIDVDIFDAGDQAVVSGMRTVRKLAPECALDEITDVVIDMTVISVGVVFPVVRFLIEHADNQLGDYATINVHVVLAADISREEALKHEFTDSVTLIHGFKGSLGLESQQAQTTRLWIPQLASGKQSALQRVYDYLSDHAPLLDVCPLLPFPSKSPRRGDELVVEYQAEMENRWSVDERNLIYVADDDPLDVYRVLVRLDRERTEVFRALGNSEMVLSPLGHKATALGCLMAAIELELPVLYVETLRYFKPSDILQQDKFDLIHVWLCGEAYPIETAS